MGTIGFAEVGVQMFLANRSAQHRRTNLSEVRPFETGIADSRSLVESFA